MTRIEQLQLQVMDMEKKVADAEYILALPWRQPPTLEKLVEGAGGALLVLGDTVVWQLEGAVREFNAAVGSYTARVLPQGRRIEQLSAIEPAGALPEPNPVETQLREISGGESEED